MRRSDVIELTAMHASILEVGPILN